MEFDRDTYDKIVEIHNDIKHMLSSVDKMSKQLADHEKRIQSLEKCSIEEHEDRIQDHETRIRAIETQQNQWLGKNAVIGFVVLILLQSLGALYSIFGGR